MPSAAVHELPLGPRGALWQTMRYVRNPLQFYLSLVAQYGDTFSVPSVLGRVVVISHPSDIHALFALPIDAFERLQVGAVEPLLGRHSVLLTSGREHQQQRKMLAPAFHRERIYGIAEGIAAITRAHAAEWPREREFDLQPRMVELSIVVILAALFGVREPASASRFRVAILDTLAAMGPKLMLSQALSTRLADVFGGYARFKSARAVLDQLLYEQIDAAPITAQTFTMLEVLRAVRDPQGQGLAREEMRDALMTLLFAGHETSAIALTWAIHWLQRCPEALATLLAELAAAPDAQVPTLAGLPYLDSVCKETLRLHPVVPEVIRKLKAPLVLRSCQLPAGTPVVACIAALQHRPDLYGEPQGFDPQRFLTRKYTAHEYAPFGGGAHRCPGEAFALLEMKVILATLLSQLRFVPTQAQVVAPTLRSITMGPRGGLRVVVQARGDVR